MAERAIPIFPMNDPAKARQFYATKTPLPNVPKNERGVRERSRRRSLQNTLFVLGPIK